MLREKQRSPKIERISTLQPSRNFPSPPLPSLPPFLPLSTHAASLSLRRAHLRSMISSILSLRGVANPPFFQVLGKRRDGSSAGMVRISVVQDDALRPLHFCVCVMESAAGAGGLGVAAGGTPGVAASAAPSGGFVTTMRGVGDGRDNGGCGIAAGTGVSGAGGGSEGGGRIDGGGAL